ncbi:MAG: tetratricopeptide repeat protein [Actinomycetota bacterium]
MRGTGRVIVVAGLAVAVFSLGGIGLLRRVRPEPRARPSAEASSALQRRPVVESASVAAVISGLQERLKAVPGDWRGHAQLGMAYVQQARITGDPSYYPKAEGVLRRSLALRDEANVDAMIGMAALATARHDFAAALSWGLRAKAVDPGDATIYALIGDAQVELGRYDEAFHAFQRMIDLRPDLSSYARASYAWELQGSYPNAVEAMELALQAAVAPADVAWASGQLGDLHFSRGRLREARRHYRRALAADEYVPARVGLARVDAARGRVREAIRGYLWAVERFPIPEYVISLGDLYTLTGDRERADRQYALLEVQERLLRANGVNVDLEVALFNADHNVNLRVGLALAEAEWSRRKSVHVADAMAWSLYAAGRFEEALDYADQALRLGTQNALFFFHRGMIERALGKNRAARSDLARALAINPHFSILWSGEATRAIETLGGAP